MLRTAELTKKTILIILATFGLALSFQLASQSSVYADSHTNDGLFSGARSEACAGAQLQSVDSRDCQADEVTGLDNTIKNVINILSVVIGIAAVIMIIVSGFRFIVSGGDATGVGNAKKGIIYAVVGLIIVALAQFIVKFVIDRSTGTVTPDQNQDQSSLIQYVATSLVHML